MTSLLLRNLFFTILQPGVIAGLIPYWILNGNIHFFTGEFTWVQFTAIGMFITGFIILIVCVYRFALEGRGTLSPVDPTQKLVIHGLYKYSRNPMYIGVMLILISEAMIYKSTGLWIYAFIIMVTFYLFILLHEEPYLKKEFGDEYREYCQRVRRWI